MPVPRRACPCPTVSGHIGFGRTLCPIVVFAAPNIDSYLVLSWPDETRLLRFPLLGD